MISEAGVKIQKLKLQKKVLKDILNNVKSNYKAQATVSFSISTLMYEIWAKNAYILKIKDTLKFFFSLHSSEFTYS